MTASPEVLADGYQLAEAPRVAEDGTVYFSDALGGGVYRWTDGAGVATVVPKRRGVGGLALHADGGVVVGGRSVLHVPGEGAEQRTILDAPAGVVGFNDLCALPDGSVLAGGLRWLPFGGDDERVPGEFWRITAAGGDPSVAFDGIVWANGCGADGARDRLYACDYASGRVWLRDADGVRVFADVPGGEADGLAVDHEGGVWVATAQGGTIVQLDPDDGAIADTIELGGLVTSLAFDGGDGLYVTTSTSLLRLDAPVPGPRHRLATI